MTVVQTAHGFLGKKAAVRPDLDDFKRYFSIEPGPPPPQAHYGGRVKAPWQMDGNGPDPSVTLPGVPANWPGCGDCVACAMAHFDLLSNYDESDPVASVTPPTANDVVSAYAQLAGCTTTQLFADPGTFDTGLDMSNALTSWTKGSIFGTTLGLFAPVDQSNIEDIQNAIYLTGAVIMGVNLPQSAETEFPGTWTYVAGSPDLGGHGIILTGYTQNLQMFWGVSWGQLIGISEQFVQEYADEAYAAVSAQAVTAGKSPTGLAIADLQADINAL